ncbi:autophagy-related protein 27 [Panaeolus papilionaceus]|nr:autophagy-related protein 27 [Panaeolus papilionaceus]
MHTRVLPLEFIVSTLLLLTQTNSLVLEDKPFDCHLIIGRNTFDLTQLAGEHVVNRTRETPPTIFVDSVKINLCADLKQVDSAPKEDQCVSGTRVCLVQSNLKPNESERVTAVIPIAQTEKLNPTYDFNPSPKHLSLLLHGGDYPSPLTNGPTAQSLNLTVICDPGVADVQPPKFIAYDGSRLDLEWSTSAGCPFDDGDKKGDEKPDGDDKTPEKDKDKDVGRGLGFFFIVILLAFAAYFGLGAYYNYSTYGARGYDLIPHRDFWKEVPYMLSDVVSHLCSGVRSRRTTSRGGYISV